MKKLTFLIIATIVQTAIAATYVDNFDVASNPMVAPWTVIPGSGYLPLKSNGTYCQAYVSGGADTSAMSYIASISGDQYIKAHMKDPPYGVTGLTFRFSESQKNGYAVIFGYNKYNYYRFDNGTPTLIGETVNITDFADSTLMSVEVVGDTLKTYINNTLSSYRIDDTYIDGYCGIIMPPNTAQNGWYDFECGDLTPPEPCTYIPSIDSLVFDTLVVGDTSNIYGSNFKISGVSALVDNTVGATVVSQTPILLRVIIPEVEPGLHIMRITDSCSNWDTISFYVIPESDTDTTIIDFCAAPEIIYVVPDSGLPNSDGKLIGNEFKSTGGTLTLAGVEKTISRQVDDTVYWNVGTADTGTHELIFIDSCGNSDTASFRVIAGVAAPVIDSIRPSPWYRLRQIDIYGSGYGDSQGEDSILVGGINLHRASLWTDTHITDTLPDTVGVFDVNVKGVIEQLRILKPRSR